MIRELERPCRPLWENWILITSCRSSTSLGSRIACSPAPISPNWIKSKDRIYSRSARFSSPRTKEALQIRKGKVSKRTVETEKFIAACLMAIQILFKSRTLCKPAPTRTLFDNKTPSITNLYRTRFDSKTHSSQILYRTLFDSKTPSHPTLYRIRFGSKTLYQRTLYTTLCAIRVLLL